MATVQQIIWPFCKFPLPCLLHVFFFLVFLDKSQRDFWVKHPLGTEKSFVLGWQVLYWVQLSQDNDSYTSAFSILTLYREFGLY